MNPSTSSGQAFVSRWLSPAKPGLVSIDSSTSLGMTRKTPLPRAAGLNKTGENRVPDKGVLGSALRFEDLRCATRG